MPDDAIMFFTYRMPADGIGSLRYASAYVQ